MTHFTFIGTTCENEGYGKATAHTVKALRQLGADFDVVPINHKELSWPEDRIIKVDGLAFVWSVPEYWNRVEADELWGAFVWETTLLPRYRVDLINERVTRLFTFSEWAREMFISSGVSIPVHVMPHGVSPDEYFWMERPVGRKPYTFLLLGELAERKGWDIAYTAFLEEFGEDPDARLIMKTRGRCPLAPCSDPNVEVIAEEYNIPQMRELYGLADCFLFPSRGEGYGIPPREAAATGLPCVVTDWSGLREGGIHNYAFPLRVGQMVRANYGYQTSEPCGDWAQPDSGHLRYLMRMCYDNPKMAWQQGRLGATWARWECSWQVGARVLLEAVDAWGI